MLLRHEMVALMIADGGRGHFSFLVLVLSCFCVQLMHPVYEIGRVASTNAREVLGV